MSEPLTKGEAKLLDSKIRAAGGKLAANVTAIRDLLDKAAQADVHAALGYSSWSAYLRDAVPALYDPKSRICKPVWTR
jgi:hypothetical protein